MDGFCDRRGNGLTSGRVQDGSLRPTPAAERATVFREAAARCGWVLPRSLKKISGSAGRCKESSQVRRCRDPSSKAGPRFPRSTRSSSVSQKTLTSSSTAMLSDSPETRTLPTSRAQTSGTENWMNWRANVRRLFRRRPQRLQNSFRSILGEADWKISEDPADADRQSLLFAYPLGLEADLYGLGTYIRPVIRLEFGCRGDVWPSEQQSIQPYIADAFPGLLARPTAEVHVLRPERTFWEKARYSMPSTIRARCRPASRGTTMTSPDCTGTNTGSSRSRSLAARKRSRAQKGFLPRSCSAVRSGRPGSLGYALRTSHVAQIRSDYRDMREMFFPEPRPFDTVMSDLRELEDRVNR